MSDAPMNRPGEIAGWPKLVVTYTTDPANVAALLPPGLEPLDPDGHRRLLLRAGARRARVRRQREGRGGVAGASPASTASASASTRRPPSTSAPRPTASRSSSATSPTSASATRSRPGPATRATRSSSSPARVTGEAEPRRRRLRRARVVDEVLAGHRRRRAAPTTSRRTSSTWRPRSSSATSRTSTATLRAARQPVGPDRPLPARRRPGRAQLVTHQPKARVITNAGPLDPDAFWPHADVIGGSRWPGDRGGRPRRGGADGRDHRPLRRHLRRLPRRRRASLGYRPFLASKLPRRLRRAGRPSSRTPTTTTPAPTPTATGARSAGCGRWRPTASSPRCSSPTPSRRSSRRSRSSTSRRAPTDGDLARRWAGLQAHNRWLADFCSQAPGRRAGIAQIMLHDVDASVARDRVGQGRTGSPAASSCPAPRPAPACRRSTPPTTSRSGRPARTSACPINHHSGSAVPDMGAVPGGPDDVPARGRRGGRTGRCGTSSTRG